MHIPDGFVNAPVAISTGVLTVGAFAYAVRRAGKTLPASRNAILGVSAAFIFAAQMVNFPVAAGTSGHLVGATLAAVLLGPSAAVIAMSAVVLLQCFVFADGGVSALGANALNMAVLAPMVAYAAYRLTLPLVRGHSAIAAGVAGWFSIVAAAAACAGEIALSGKQSPSLILPAMLGVHAIIGVGEGLITAMVVAGIAKSRPELLDSTRATGLSSSAVVPVTVFGTLVALGLAMFVAPFASPLPDGLERVAQELGFHIAEPILPGLLPDYTWGAGGTALAGVAGTILVLGMVLLVGKLLVRSSPQPASDE